jgi:hypothetical protein
VLLGDWLPVYFKKCVAFIKGSRHMQNVFFHIKAVFCYKPTKVKHIIVVLSEYKMTHFTVLHFQENICTEL